MRGNNLLHTLSILRRTSSSLPQRSEAFLSQNLSETVDDSCVSGLSGPGGHLQTRLDDIRGRHQGGCGDAWGRERTPRRLRPLQLAEASGLVAAL